MSDRYRLARLFAKGGMAEVYLGTAVGAEGFEKPVAIKRLLPELARDPRLAEMFLAEARLAKFLNHQNVVQVLDVGKSHQELYLVMELVDGWDLELLSELAKSRGVPFPPHLAAFVISQALAGLIHAYRRTHEGKPLITAHRDVSGSNVLVSREGEVKVTDFGIARMEGISMEKTEPGTFKGKVPYSAPELLRGGSASHLSDQFSLGVIAYKLVAGRHPFSESDRWSSYVAALERDDAAPLDAPPAFANLVSKMLAKDPAARFESPEALDRALGAYLARCGEPTSPRELAAFVEQLAPPASAAEKRAQHAQEVLGGTFSLKGQVDAFPLTQALEDAPGEAWQPSGPVMDVSGSVQRKPAAGAPRAEAPLELDRPPRRYEDAPLELAHEPIVNREIPPDPNPPPSLGKQVRRTVRRLVVFGLLVALVGGGVVFGLPVLKDRLKRTEVGDYLGTNPKAAVLYVDSIPDGARVRIDGRDVGQTPLVLENYYGPQEIPLEVQLRGYGTWKGTFTGGKDARVEAKLKRR